jgi:hypothetical protein
MPLDPWSPPFVFAIASFATWRLSHLIAREDGPFGLIVRLRLRLGDGVLGRAMDCPHCLSLWLAMPFALLLADRPLSWIAAWLAIAGAASLLQHLIDRPDSGEH